MKFTTEELNSCDINLQKSVLFSCVMLFWTNYIVKAVKNQTS